MQTTNIFHLLGAAAAVILVFSHWTDAASPDDYDDDYANDHDINSAAYIFDSFMSKRSKEEYKCNTNQRCFKKGGECVEAGTCSTIEIKETCSRMKKCSCCAKDKKNRCKQSKKCEKKGGFCVTNRKACAEGKLVKGECKCKDKGDKGGHCCVPPTQPPIQCPTQPPIQCPTQPPVQCPTQPPIQCPTQPTTQPPTQPSTEPQGGCPDDFEELAGYCYYFSIDHGEKRNWEQARKFCQEIGFQLGLEVDLADFSNENSCNSHGLLMQKIAEKGQWTWLGATDEAKEDEWKWVHSGSSLSIMDSYWYRTEPNHDGDCLLAYIPNPSGFGRSFFGDWVCSHEGQFVCQIY